MLNCIIVNPATAVSQRQDGTAAVLEIAAGALVEIRRGSFADYQRTGAKPDQAWVVDGAPAAAVPPAKPGYASEILQMVPHGSVDKFGNLLNPDGSVHTFPDQHEPLRATYASEQELLDDIARIHYPYQVKIDGRLLPYTQHGQEPVAWFVADQVTGRITHPYAIPVNPPSVPLPPPPAGSAVDVDTTVAWPASGQVRPYTTGFSTGTQRFRIKVPAALPGLVPAHMGFMRVTERPGHAVLARFVSVTVNGIEVYNNAGDGDTSPGVSFTVNNSEGYLGVGANFNLQFGDDIVFAVRNGENATTQGSDILFDFATPNRY